MARRNTLKVDVVADVTKAEREILRFSGHVKRFGKEITDLGKGLSTFSAPLVALGGYAAKAALDIDDALDKIAAGTGETGAALAGLESDFRAVAGAAPQAFDDTAKAIADLNTRLGLHGEALQDTAKAALNASRLMDTSLTETIRQSTRAMQNWNIPAMAASVTLDKLFVASQRSGSGMDSLGAALAQYGPILRSLGVDFDRALALIAQFEREGVNLESVMAGLKRALATMAKEGVSPDRALDRIIASIRNAGSAAEASKRSVAIFGARSGPELAAAIREGRFSIEDMVGALARAQGQIAKTTAETDGFSEEWQRTMNQAKLALEPLGGAVVRMAERFLPRLQKSLGDLKGAEIENKVHMGLWLVGISAGTLAVGTMTETVASLIRNLRLLAATWKTSMPILAALSAMYELKSNMDDSERASSSL